MPRDPTVRWWRQQGPSVSRLFQDQADSITHYVTQFSSSVVWHCAYSNQTWAGSEMDMGWVNPWVGLGWVGLGLGLNFSFCNGLGWVQLKNWCFLFIRYWFIYSIQTQSHTSIEDGTVSLCTDMHMEDYRKQSYLDMHVSWIDRQFQTLWAPRLILLSC